MSGDWLKLHRQSVDSAVFADANLWRLWCWCLFRATYKAKHVSLAVGRGSQLIELTPGQFIFGRHRAAEALEWSPSTVRRRMEKLQELGNVDIKNQKHFSVVTVCNWTRYQTGQTQPIDESGQHTDSIRTTYGAQTDSIRTQVKKEYKGRRDKNKRTATKSPAFVPDLEALSWPKHLNTAPARKALEAWSEYKQATPHRWDNSQGPQALVDSFADYSADQFVTQINLALAHGSCKTPWLPSNTFGKTPAQTRPGHITTDHKLQRELDRSGRIQAARKAVRDSKDEATRMTLQQQLDRLLEESSA